MRLRRAEPDDESFLLHVLAIAADWRPDQQPRSVHDVLASPGLAHYVPDWSRGRDRGVVAELAPAGPVGAAWWRFLPREDPGYGFVAPDVPELCVGVVREHRGQGVGSALLRELIASAAQEGLRGVSLSVETDNPAARLYARLGFTRVGGAGGSDTMLLSLR